MADFDVALQTAIDVRRLGVRLLLIGVGTEVNELGLSGVASWPTADTVFIVRSASNLTKIRDLVIQSTCDGRCSLFIPYMYVNRGQHIQHQ